LGAVAVAVASGQDQAMSTSIALEALELSKHGDRDAAIALLQEARANGPLDDSATSVLFTLLGDRGCDIDDDDDRLALCDHGLTIAKRVIQRSTWHLRRGLLRLGRGDGKVALLDLQAVLSLKASEDHVSRARAALLEVATSTRPSKRS
jgi:hypothetical protein